jgi:hypothetical protein
VLQEVIGTLKRVLQSTARVKPPSKRPNTDQLLLVLTSTAAIPQERFFRSLNKECAWQQNFMSFAEARRAVRVWLE